MSAALAFAMLSSAWGFPVTWTLSGATFTDGGTATGSFIYDADTNTLSNWSVSVGGGNTTNFPPLTYDPSTSSASLTSFAGVKLDINAPSYRQIRMPTVGALTDAGGTLALDLANAYQGECFNCSPYRSFNAGSLVGTPAPPTITSANSTSFMEAIAGSFTVTTIGGPVVTISESGTLPGAVTFVDNGDGTATLSGTPATGSAGSYPITLTASNGVVPDATQNFTLTVVAAPTATPTLGWPGMFALLLLLLAGALGTLWRKDCLTP